MEFFGLSLDCILKHLMSHSHLGKKNECSFNSHRKDNLDVSQGMKSTGVCSADQKHSIFENYIF